ncbi:hypothetical protein CcCBS67573_g00287 [Chytriomyces confervae]|uniref:RRM domain-containing protein n=1 Tax=Chytriomyces confervae TaxID=246404 RepID=A0A507FSZ0_9FUNG|nr:hypothetical protein HDU80_005434 [Chytriomyces hyalinus]TPX78408.1 hypothetical protein CcCBS67573_g00287 [Chytriomyces confervae]
MSAAEQTTVGPDGVTYKWDTTSNSWITAAEGQNEVNPALDPSIAVFDTSDDPTSIASMSAKANTNKRKHPTNADDNSVAEQKQQAPKKKFNSSIYITNLPPDTTAEELAETFSKYGLIMEDLSTGKPRIKMYQTENGEFKGDALVTFFKEESVRLAVDLMDDAEFRFGMPGTKIHVSQAVFKEKEKPAEDAAAKGAASAKGKQDKKKVQKKIQNLQKKLDWFEEENGKKSDKFARIVILKHMFTKQEIDEDPTLLIDLKEEVREECEKLGEVTNVVMYDHSDDGVMTVRFKEVEAAAKCVEKNNNRFFGGRRIVAYLFDGKEKFKETKTASQIQAEEEQRLSAFENWLEENH